MKRRFLSSYGWKQGQGRKVRAIAISWNSKLTNSAESSNIPPPKVDRHKILKTRHTSTTEVQKSQKTAKLDGDGILLPQHVTGLRSSKGFTSEPGRK